MTIKGDPHLVKRKFDVDKESIKCLVLVMTYLSLREYIFNVLVLDLDLHSRSIYSDSIPY